MLGEVRLRHGGAVNATAITSDGKRAFTASTLAGGSAKEGRHDETIRVWDTATGAELHAIPVRGPVSFAPEIARAVATTAAKGLVLIDLASGKTIRALATAGAPRAIALSPDGTTILEADQRGEVVLLSAETGERVRSFEPDPDGRPVDPRCVAFSSDGGQAVSWGEGGTKAGAWNVATGRRHSRDEPWRVPDPSGIGREDGTIDLPLPGFWPSEVKGVPIKAHRGAVLALAYSRQQLLSGGADGVVRLWDVRARKAASKSSRGPIAALAFSLDGAKLRCASVDLDLERRGIRSERALSVLDARDGRELSLETERDAPALAIALAPEGRAEVGPGRIFVRTALGALEERSNEPNALGDVIALPWDGRFVAIAGGGTLRLVDLVKEVSRTAACGPVRALALSPDRKTAIVVGSAPSEGRSAGIIDLETGKPLRWLPVKDEARALSISPDGKRLALLLDGAVAVRDLATGDLVDRTELPPTAGEALSIAFSPDGKTVAAGSAAGLAVLLEER